MKVSVQVVLGVIVGWALFYFMGLEQVELFKFLYQYINSTVFYFSVVVAVLVICFTVLRKFKVFGVAVVVTMVGLFILIYIALNTGMLGF